MSEETVEQQASLMGWVPKEQFHGNESNWVDAEAFVEKGKHIMPILKKNNERLIGQVTSLSSKIQTLESALTEQTAAMESFREFHEEATKTQVAAARKEILAQVKEARESGDVDQEIELTSKLSSFDAAAASKPAPAPTSPAPKVEPETPEFKAWKARNPWYGVDHVKSGAIEGIAKKLRDEGNTKIGTEFLNEVSTELDRLFGVTEKSSPTSRVEGSRGGGGGSSGGNTYASLPADARAVCDKQAEKFVGKNKLFPDVKSWQAHFVKHYAGE